MKRAAIGKTVATTALGLFSAAVQVQGQVPEGYEVVRVTELSGIKSRPDISSNSAVIWAHKFSSTEATVYMFKDGIVRPVTDATHYNAIAAINDSDDFVVHMAPSSAGPFDVGLYIAGDLVQVIDAFDAGSSIDINTMTNFVWHDNFSEDGTNTELFLYDGQSVQQLTTNGLQNVSARINNSNEIVFTVNDLKVQPNTSFVMMYSNGALIPLTDDEIQHASPNIDNAGRVVWAEFDATVNRIVCWEDGTTSILVEQVGICCPRINNEGDMVHGWYNPDTASTELVMRTHAGAVLQIPSLGLGCDLAEINDRLEATWRGIDLSTLESGILLLRRTAPKGDFNHDCRIDSYDYTILENCFTGDGLGPAAGLLAECVRADFDSDRDVDEEDVSSFLASVTGPGALVIGCEP